MSSEGSREVQQQASTSVRRTRELCRAVFRHTDRFRWIISLVGPGEHFFVAATCKKWQAAYRKSMKGVRNSRRKLVNKTSTSYGAVFGSPSRLQLAVLWDFPIRSPSLKAVLARAAGRYANLKTVQLTVQLGLAASGAMMEGAARSVSIQKVQWLQQRCADLNVAVMAAAAAAGSVGMLQYLRSIGQPWDSSVTDSAAGGGHLVVLKWLIYESCPVAAASLARAAARGGNVELMNWLHTEQLVNFAATNMISSANFGHKDALVYLSKELELTATAATWRSAVTRTHSRALQLLFDHCDLHLDSELHQ